MASWIDKDEQCLIALKKSTFVEAVRLSKLKSLFSSNGMDLLHLAASNGWLDVVKVLVSECGCDPMIADVEGRTCLHVAAEKNHNDIVMYFIAECGCDPMFPDIVGRTCLHVAIENNHIDIIKYLITQCCCTPKTDKVLSRRCFDIAIRIVDIDFLKYLINECGCDPLVAQDLDEWGRTCLHIAVLKNYINIVKYLITECGCDPTVANEQGRTCLHIAVERCHLSLIEYLLSTGKVNPLAKDAYNTTPIKLAKGNETILSLFSKFGKIKLSHPVDSYVNVLLLGNPGAGKSTLAQVIIERSNKVINFGQFKNVKGVEECTAGIVPTKLQHRELGNIILHDFAGHSEYYSSHTTVIENLLQGSGAVFVILVNITKEESAKHLQQWLTLINNEVHKAISHCRIIVAVSHLDEMTDTVIKSKRHKQLLEIIRSRCSPSTRLKCLDCRKLGGGNITSLINKLSNSCQSIRNKSGKNLSLYCHMMYSFLEDSNENVLLISDILNSPVKYQHALPKTKEEIYKVLLSLSSTGLICLLKSHADASKVWVVFNKQILLAEVNGILFAPKSFKEHRDVASNTGIITSSSLAELFNYDTDMLISFFKNMALCQEINSFYLSMTNLATQKEKPEQKLLFFPTLLSIDRPSNITGRVFKFGWCLQCTEDYLFFPFCFFHIVMLNLAFKFGLPKHSGHLAHINRQCIFWRNGIHWFNGKGVETLVEIINDNQCVLVLMSCKEGYEKNMVSLRREVIKKVIKLQLQSCPDMKLMEYLIDPEELKYPIDKPTQNTIYNVADVVGSIRKKRDFVSSELFSNWTILKEKAIKDLLPDENTTDVTQLSLLGERDPKELASSKDNLVLINSTQVTEDFTKTAYNENSSGSYSMMALSRDNIDDTEENLNDTTTDVTQLSLLGETENYDMEHHDIEHHDIEHPLTLYTDKESEITTKISEEETTAVILPERKHSILSSNEELLDLGDLDDIIAFLKRHQFANHHWEDLGLQLGIYKPTLEDIDDKCRGDPHKCLMECLAAWLKREDKVMEKGGPSWTSLAGALSIIGEYSIASCIM